MAQVWKPQSTEIYKSWVDAIVEEGSDKLTDWETNFISDIGVKINYGLPLSYNQASTLEKIYVRATS